MGQFFEFRHNSSNISHDCRAIVAKHSYDSRETFVPVSHDILTNVA